MQNLSVLQERAVYCSYGETYTQKAPFDISLSFEHDQIIKPLADKSKRSICFISNYFRRSTKGVEPPDT